MCTSDDGVAHMLDIGGPNTHARPIEGIAEGHCTPLKRRRMVGDTELQPHLRTVDAAVPPASAAVACWGSVLHASGPDEAAKAVQDAAVCTGWLWLWQVVRLMRETSPGSAARRRLLADAAAAPAARPGSSLQQLALRWQGEAGAACEIGVWCSMRTWQRLQAFRLHVAAQPAAPGASEPCLLVVVHTTQCAEAPIFIAGVLAVQAQPVGTTMNQEQALAAYEKAKAMLAHDRARALKLCKLSLRLHATPECATLLRQLEEPPLKKGSEGGAPSPTPGGDPKATPSPRASAGSSPAQGRNEAGAEWNADDAAIVRQVRQAKSYYEVLSVTKTCNAAQLKKAYRKLAIKIHPDKNHAPGAEDAFKTVGQAYATLSDERKKQLYDLQGHDIYVNGGAQQSRGSPMRRGHGATHHRFGDEMTPEEIFRMFFSGAAFPQHMHHPTRRRFRAARPRAHQVPERPHAMSLLLQLLPVLIFVAFAFLSSLGGDHTLYSLSRTRSHRTQQFTSDYQLPYWVTSDFEKEYGPEDSVKWRNVEQEVERAWISHWTQDCRDFEHQRARRVRMAWTKTERDRLNGLESEACVNLRRIHEMSRRGDGNAIPAA